MAQEAPSSPNAGGTGNRSSDYTEVRAPQFVGGATDPTSGNVVPANANTAAVAPPPQTPTTKLATVGKTPSLATQLGGAALETAAPIFGAGAGSALAGGASLAGAAGAGVSNLTGTFKDLTGFGGKTATSAGDAAFANGSAPTSFVDSNGGTDLSATPATAPASSSSSVSSTLGGAAGAGVGSGLATAIVGAVEGEKPKQYLTQGAESGAGAAVGYAIGNTLLPGIGGTIGGALGSLFCHAAGTMIRMEDGSRKAVEALQLGDRVLLGGAVFGRGEVLADDLFEYRGTVLNGRHAVFENGRWLRVRDTMTAVAWAPHIRVTVYPVVTEKHLLVCDNYLCADFAETDDEEVTPSARIRLLNANDERNAGLEQIEMQIKHGWRGDDCKRTAA